MEVLRLVPILESKVLEERVGGEWGCEEVRGEKVRRLGQDCGLSCWEEERGGGALWDQESKTDYGEDESKRIEHPCHDDAFGKFVLN